MNNMPEIINRHNKKLTSKSFDQTPKSNCRKTEYPMEGNCLVNNVVYKCDVTRPLLKRKCILDLKRENGKVASITINYQVNTRDTPIRQHF